MRYVVVINLDYENNPHEGMKRLYLQLKEALEARGFIIDGRRFVIDLEPEEAKGLAREVVEELERQYSAEGESIYPYIKEFFGFELTDATNLLLPSTDEIHVEELSENDALLIADLLEK
jgi:hypothetical protein